MNSKLDKIFWGLLTIVIVLWLTLSFCGCEYFTNSADFERLPGETNEAYLERIANIEPELRMPVIDTGEALAALIGGSGLTGLAAWIRKIKKNGHAEVEVLTAQVKTLTDRLNTYLDTKNVGSTP
jgi:hypothetical protein